MAGTDCGFATFAGFSTVDPQIVWAKFRAMAEGAALASAELWKKPLPAAERIASPAKSTPKLAPAAAKPSPRRARKRARRAAAAKKAVRRVTKPAIVNKRPKPAARVRLNKRKRRGSK
jgi:hypothetical protein